MEKVLSLVFLAALVSCEPPVQQGYNYRQPSYQNGFNAHRNNFGSHNTGYVAPTSSYLPPSSFGSGSGHTDSGYNSGSGHDFSGHDSHGHDHDNEVPKSYEFGYSVKDVQSGNDYGRRETSDGNEVRGEYRVKLPDGRTQIVTYHADWRTGFHADVRYEGEATYPEPSYNNNNNGYNYNAPDYSGSITGFHGNGNGYKPSTSYGPPGHH